MKFYPTAIGGVLLIDTVNFIDDRGAFSEIYKRDAFRDAGIDVDFFQDNRSHSRRSATIRGLHYQLPPFAQAKLISVPWGRIYDVAIDLRVSSASFGQHVAVELSAAGGEQLFIPAGFAHGFCTLEPDTVVAYKVDAPYSPAGERGIHWRSATLGIAWPCDPDTAVLSRKDSLLPDRIDPDECFP